MPSVVLNARGKKIAFPRRPLLMGIININDDSFSGDGKIDASWALDRARDLILLGADIIDVGAESARTNRQAISPQEELDRLAPFLEKYPALAQESTPRDADQYSPPLLSINTWRPEVAAPALAIAGDILNDMSGLPDDRNARICANHDAALLIMHSIGEPKVPHTHVRYDDVMTSLDGFFQEKITAACQAGLPEENILLDPGIDFAKQKEDNLAIYRNLPLLQRFQRPILLPVSRKSVIGRVLDIPNPVGRDAGTAACMVAGILRGASIFRVHNVEMAWRVTRSLQRLIPSES